MRPGVLVMAKAPVPGFAKTRLACAVGADAAAELAAASLLDTLDAAEQAVPVGRRVIALTGGLVGAPHGDAIRRRLAAWEEIGQVGKDFGHRLRHAHRSAARLLGAPVVQIGADTPQVAADQLTRAAARLEGDLHGAVLGPADDGGWWLLGAGDIRLLRRLAAVPMSAPTTGWLTERALRQTGAAVHRVDVLRDVDIDIDAEAVAALAPETRFAAAWRSLRRAPAPPLDVYDAALNGAACVVHGTDGGRTPLPVRRWAGACDAADRRLVSWCSGATLDVGCGPGRLTQMLTGGGVPALGIDVAPGAVGAARRRGAAAVQGDVFSAVPGEGEWECVLLADGNIGIGGDPARLLRRVSELLQPRGRAVVEVAPPGTPLRVRRLCLEAAGMLSAPFSWAVVGPEELAVLARAACMRMLALRSVNGRWFAELQSTDGCGAPP